MRQIQTIVTMKTRIFSLLTAATLALTLAAQVTTIPSFVPIGYKGEITIIFNPNEGNGGMKDATKCYAHTGVIIGSSRWLHAPSWRDGKHEMTKDSDGNWELKISPDVNTYYGCAATDVVTGLCFVFNDGPNGELEGKSASNGDIFIDFIEPGFYAKIQSPSESGLVSANEDIAFVGAVSEEAELRLLVNGEEKAKTYHLPK